MTDKQIAQVMPWINKKELDNVKQVLQTNWLTEGPFTRELCNKVRSLTKSKYVVPVPNGTLGLYLSLVSLDLPAGSEVIVPDFTFFASCSSIVFAGLKPALVDVSPETFQIDVEKIEEAITPNTSAIMPVHIYGQGCDVNTVRNIAAKYNLKIVEDAAQAVGCNFSSMDGSKEPQHLGTFGDAGVFSMFADKTITMGEGGFIVTNSDNTYERLKLLRNQGRENSGRFEHTAMGMNFRITDLQAAVGLAQFEKLDEVICQKEVTYGWYSERLSGYENLKMMKLTPGSEFVPFRMPVLLNNLAETIEALELANIQTRRFFYPMSKQIPLKEYAKGTFPNSEFLYDHGICLPVHRGVGEDDVNRICDIIIGINK